MASVHQFSLISLTKQDCFWSISPTPMGGGRNERQNVMRNEETLKRLKNVEGHLRGILRMVEEDAYCIDVIRQIQAVEAALNKVSSQILGNHLNSCIITAVQGNDPAERERVFKEITEVFDMAAKV